MKAKNPVILIIRDGWGYRRNPVGNLIAAAKPKYFDYFWHHYPHALLKASGEAVGLMPGYQGNSEVGHLTIGSGRIIKQSLPRIQSAIDDGSFFKNKAFLAAIKNCRQHKTALHLIALVQTQGVHSHTNHLLALLDLCRRQKFHNVYVHVMTDGRDAPPTESLKHVRVIKNKLKALGFGKIATISGRYYAMDRNLRWERTKEAYDCIALAGGPKFTEAEKAIKACHQAGVTDEFIKPQHAQGYAGLKAHDSFIFVNFRTDRTRQLTKALIEPKFTGFKRKLTPLFFVAMTQYYQPMPAAVAFPNITAKNLLGEVIADAGMKQLRISETEKYAHVTFFFNGQREEPYKGEKQLLIKSPHLATYDLQPEMSVYDIAAKLCVEIKKQSYDFIVVNLVNCDMVGHTAKKSAIIKAVQSVDKAENEIVNCGLSNGYTSILCADHGNAEDKSPKWVTSHTINPVPLVMVAPETSGLKLSLPKNAGLKDVASLVLKILGLKKPKEMR
ncbi:MAG: 2,3-bisphosphoglycerate-independent phosphoglycerate mutase [Candidatus Falkowbacteria bacterium]